MRQLLLLVGAPASGKSTWIAERNFEAHTISSDKIRLLYSGISLNLEGKKCISQRKDKQVWKILNEILISRLEDGCFTILDATNLGKNVIEKYAELAESYGYKLFVKKFECDLDELKDRNANREEYKQVPESVLEDMFNRMEEFNDKYKFTELFTEIYVTSDMFKRDYQTNTFKQTFVIGDVHGCFSAVEKFLDSLDRIEKENSQFVFLGDYIDRGSENDKMINFLIDNIDKDNFVFLEGNHEKHLRDWLYKRELKSDEFIKNTLPQLEANVDKRKLKKALKKLKPYFILDKNGRFLMSHGGLNLTHVFANYINAGDCIFGVGGYNDTDKIAEFQSKQDYVQIHGHRNVKNLPVKISDNYYNLEGKVEFDGALRVLRIVNDGVEVMEFKK